MTKKAAFTYKDMSINVEEALSVWKDTLEDVFPTKVTKETDKIETPVYSAGNVHICKNKVAKPTVFIPVFPGTNCEYDSAKAFERAGADTIVKVFKNLDAESIRESVDEFERLSARHRSSCSQAVSQQVMSQMVQLSSLQQHSVMLR